MTTYRGWQMNPKTPFAQEVSIALQYYIERFGYPPSILEYSDQVTGVEVLPEGLQMVVNAVHIPKNIILLGMKEGE